MISISHVINPYKCKENNQSYLYYAQPITFASMRAAQLKAESLGIKVTLYAAFYPEDEDVIPDYFVKLPYLKQSTQTAFGKSISGNYKLPLIQEICSSVLKNSEKKLKNDGLEIKPNNDYIIYTNLDIGLYEMFYVTVAQIINIRKLPAFVINRRNNIPRFRNVVENDIKVKKRVTEKDLDYIYKQKGTIHKGIDCIIVRRALLKKINLRNLFIGFSPIGYTFYFALLQKNRNCIVFTKMFLTFHLGYDKPKEHKLSRVNALESIKILGYRIKWLKL